MTLALGATAGRDGDPTRGFDAHVGALEGTNPGSLGVDGVADTDPAPVLIEALALHQVPRTPQQLGIVA